MVLQIIKPFILLLIAGILFLPSCYYDNEEELYPGGQAPCDTANVSYALDVAPILDSKCNGCHGGAAPSAGIRTDTYSNLVATISAGRFVGAINHTSGYSPMPKNAGKLPACELAKINAWINKGAPQN